MSLRVESRTRPPPRRSCRPHWPARPVCAASTPARCSSPTPNHCRWWTTGPATGSPRPQSSTARRCESNRSPFRLTPTGSRPASRSTTRYTTRRCEPRRRSPASPAARNWPAARAGVPPPRRTIVCRMLRLVWWCRPTPISPPVVRLWVWLPCSGPRSLRRRMTPPSTFRATAWSIARTLPVRRGFPVA
ncbi:hypothetical protein BLIC_b02002 [Bifidobacterium longum subsp. infantis]|uniref:Uncharacterized protein n=1 Tax=Bifidobacterium longum subsp. infantis TaxID=1682 RepID=A0ABP1XA02_BIFLI|nr:hypothetical protein BLIC_a01991 [Bifidobacterium longum subsp. infantis]CEF03083.1 hypothetical protein BLIC_b02002 [Bifidobacterium longum subsp. infantis]CEF04392.1 hypothetical protein BLIC_c02002 [Bifidobacterium longum subsp. infantis]CEF09176.1 hypothetical protein BLIC_e02015 [Bifidobacterium longum subsp. infantis]CEF11856.1 hypothetical protein BLIC_g01992 [Bifidobacterium longum subsp. infantis]